MGGFATPAFINLGIDATTGKSYAICSRKVLCCVVLLVFMPALVSLSVILALVVAMTGERFLFKVMIDRMESYRYFLCQLMTFLYIPPLFCIAGYRSPPDEFIEEEIAEFPKFHFFIMGILDLLHAMMLFVAGGRTDPTQTLLFMQASIPLSVALSALAFGVRYSRLQIIGAVVITIGIVVSLFPDLEDIGSDAFIDQETGWSSLMYLLAAVPGALSMIYKEHSIRDQPMDMVYLNAWVSVNQFVAGLLLAPIVFDLEFLHLDQKMSGLQCLIQGKSEIPSDECYLGLPLLLLYITANVAINLLLLQLVKLTSVSTVDGSALLGFLTSFAVLAWYQTDPKEFGRMHLHGDLRDWIPPSVFIDLLAFLAILVGKILFQWEPDPEVHATTLSAEDKEAASLLNGDEDYGLRYT